MGSTDSGWRQTILRRIYNSSLPVYLFNLYLLCWTAATSRYPVGENVFDREWDVLVILDTCRVDALRTVAPEYEFLSEVEAMTSVGSTSPEWIANTFTTEYRDEINSTGYLSVNPFQEHVIVNREFPPSSAPIPHTNSPTNYGTVKTDQFQHLEDAWESQPGHRHSLPRLTTDRAIALAREKDFDRLIIHYAPPHQPYRSRALAENRERNFMEEKPFKAMRSGVSKEEIWDLYLDELRWVLDDVAVLLQNLEADRVAISADHGEGFGEWGWFNHGTGIILPKVKQVPWVETSATDTGSYDPMLTSPSEGAVYTEGTDGTVSG